MAEKILSQGEVDALLQHSATGNGLSGLQTYDLTSTRRVIPSRILTLEMIGEQCARYFQTALGSALTKELECTMGGVSTKTCGDLIAGLPLLSSINIITLEPLKGNALVILEGKTVYSLLHSFFGGSGRIHERQDGDFTPIEQKFVQKIVTMLLGCLNKAWQTVHPVTVLLSRSETNPKLAMVVPPTELMILVPLQVKLEGQTAQIMLGLPYPTVEPIWEKLCALYQGQEKDTLKEWQESLRMQLGDCKAAVWTDLGVASLAIRQIAALKPGDVVMLDRVRSDEIDLCVEGVVKFKGRPGAHRGNMALEITSITA